MFKRMSSFNNFYGSQQAIDQMNRDAQDEPETVDEVQEEIEECPDAK